MRRLCVLGTNAKAPLQTVSLVNFHSLSKHIREARDLLSMMASESAPDDAGTSLGHILQLVHIKKLGFQATIALVE